MNDLEAIALTKIADCVSGVIGVIPDVACFTFLGFWVFLAYRRRS